MRSFDEHPPMLSCVAWLTLPLSKIQKYSKKMKTRHKDSYVENSYVNGCFKNHTECVCYEICWWMSVKSDVIFGGHGNCNLYVGNLWTWSMPQWRVWYMCVCVDSIADETCLTTDNYISLLVSWHFITSKLVKFCHVSMLWWRAVVAQWLRQLASTQQTWAQLPFAPILSHWWWDEGHPAKIAPSKVKVKFTILH